MHHVLFIILSVLASLPGVDRKPANDYVHLAITVSQKVLKPGESGALLFSFSPKKGIYVTTDPPFEFRLDTLRQLFTLGKLELAKDEKGYIRSRQPVVQHFSVLKKTPPGIYTVKGTLVYYYCSDAEGWCSRFKQPVEFSLTVK